MPTQHPLPNFPLKRCSAGALIRDPDGRILIVKPAYRPEWLLPGGIAEENESPLVALQREVREEIGLSVMPQSLLCVDYMPAHGQYGESIHFLFDCGVIDSDAAASIAPIDDELSAARFLLWAEAKLLLADSVARRLSNLADGCYFEKGDSQLPFQPLNIDAC
jgi:8-oxo-dGTP diphosphatase